MSTTRLPALWTRLKPSTTSVSKVKKAVRIPVPQTASEYLKYIPGSTILSLSKPSESQRLDIIRYKNEETKARVESKMKSDVPREVLDWTEALTSDFEKNSVKDSITRKPKNNGKDIQKKTVFAFVEDDADEKIRYYVTELLRANAKSGIILKYLENIADLILKFPHTKEYALKKGLDKSLLFLKKNKSDRSITKACDKVLVLLGHVKPVNGNGIRILSVDGGGVRGN